MRATWRITKGPPIPITSRTPSRWIALSATTPPRGPEPPSTIRKRNSRSPARTPRCAALSATMAGRSPPRPLIAMDAIWPISKRPTIRTTLRQASRSIARCATPRRPGQAHPSITPKPGFPSPGAHKPLRCSQCHTGGQFSATRPTATPVISPISRRAPIRTMSPPASRWTAPCVTALRHGQALPSTIPRLNFPSLAPIRRCNARNALPAEILQLFPRTAIPVIFRTSKRRPIRTTSRLASPWTAPYAPGGLGNDRRQYRRAHPD